MSAVVACVLGVATGASGWPPPVVFDHAGDLVVEADGFRVHLVGDMLRHPDLCERVLATLRADLRAVRGVVPPEAYALLASKVPIWIEHRGAVVPGGMSGRGMVFHPSGIWLRANGLDPSRAGAVEIVRAEDYLAWRDHQPSMVLHELAHALHHLAGDEVSSRIDGAFRSAEASGVYEAVSHAGGGPARRAYALTNSREYFAEITEAYFGRNDFAPFEREELVRLDPIGAGLVGMVWDAVGRGDFSQDREPSGRAE